MVIPVSPTTQRRRTLEVTTQRFSPTPPAHPDIKCYTLVIETSAHKKILSGIAMPVARSKSQSLQYIAYMYAASAAVQ